MTPPTNMDRAFALMLLLRLDNTPGWGHEREDAWIEIIAEAVQELGTSLIAAERERCAKIAAAERERGAKIAERENWRHWDDGCGDQIAFLIREEA